MDECPICGRNQELDCEFCEYHEKAFANLREAFPKWQEALEITWLDYLEKVREADETGSWAYEVIDYIMSENAPSTMKEYP